MKTRLPVRSALFKQRTGGLVVRWVTTSEYPLLYVFAFLFLRVVLLVWERGLLGLVFWWVVGGVVRGLVGYESTVRCFG